MNVIEVMFIGVGDEIEPLLCQKIDFKTVPFFRMSWIDWEN